MSEKKIAVVTGGARGIGKAIALELAKAGNLVVINYNGSEEKARETKAEIEAAGGQADILQCNVADFDACEAFFKAVAEKYGRVDILVNNAGVTKDGLLMKMSEEDFDRVLDTNLKGAFHTIRHASRYFLKQKSGKNDAEAEKRPDHQPFIGGRPSWKCRTGQLCGIQSRDHRSYKIRCKGAGIQRDHGQRHCTGIYQNRYDGRAF